MAVTLLIGDCLDELRALPDNSVDAVVTDPPYGLSNTDPGHVAEAVTQWVSGNREFLPSVKGGFMGKEWDSFVPPVAVWDECLRVLKPGGHLLAFAGARTQDLMGLSIRLAGFDIRDSFAWLYGSGFPKSMDLSKAIDKAAGAEREVVGSKIGRPGYSLAPGKGNDVYGQGWGGSGDGEKEAQITAPATDAAKQWEGWGTALKPAFEPVIMARKPFKGTVAANVLEHGTGALNIDASRLGALSESEVARSGKSTTGIFSGLQSVDWKSEGKAHPGRFPANVLLDESQAAVLDEQSGTLKSGANPTRRNSPKFGNAYGDFEGTEETPARGADSGGASRFFYVAKAPKKERPVVDGVAHPTVKPLALMRYLIRMVTPPGGVVLDPFAGSGTTAEAAIQEGFECITIEREAEYAPLIQARIDRNPDIAPAPVSKTPAAPKKPSRQRRKLL